MIEQILFIVYILVIVIVCIKIIIDTNVPSKALAYILLVVAVPLIGIFFYFAVGLNYRKRKLYNRKFLIDDNAFPELENQIKNYNITLRTQLQEELSYFYPLSQFLSQLHLISNLNRVSLLTNGEQKFPEVLKALREAKHHIHIEYYIFGKDSIGQEIVDILIAKHKEGVQIRFLYDDFGSREIRRNLVKKLQRAGIEVAPFYKVTFIAFANRINYRDHRKIIVIDGKIGFVGGINVKDEYINFPLDSPKRNEIYWRDTHLKIEGISVLNLQRTFLNDWNFSSDQDIGFKKELYPIKDLLNGTEDNQIVQILASGPDSDYPKILYSIVQILLLAKEELLLTTPYFIPPAALLDAMKMASLRGVKVKLLVPKNSDSKIVDITSRSYFSELLDAGVEIYLYEKGFIHAKTLVCDDYVSIVGTANLDHRSFDLNFEINAVVYDEKLAAELKDDFIRDLTYATQVDADEWNARSKFKIFLEKFLHLFSNLM